MNPNSKTLKKLLSKCETDRWGNHIVPNTTYGTTCGSFETWANCETLHDSYPDETHIRPTEFFTHYLVLDLDNLTEDSALEILKSIEDMKEDICLDYDRETQLRRKAFYDTIRRMLPYETPVEITRAIANEIYNNRQEDYIMENCTFYIEPKTVKNLSLDLMP